MFCFKVRLRSYEILNFRMYGSYRISELAKVEDFNYLVFNCVFALVMSFSFSAPSFIFGAFCRKIRRYRRAFRSSPSAIYICAAL